MDHKVFDAAEFMSREIVAELLRNGGRPTASICERTILAGLAHYENGVRNRESVEKTVGRVILAFMGYGGTVTFTDPPVGYKT